MSLPARVLLVSLTAHIVIVGVSAGQETCKVVTPVSGGTNASTEDLELARSVTGVCDDEDTDLRVREVFDLLLGSSPNGEKALSLTEDVECRGVDDEDAGDVKWPLARAFALARVGEAARAAGQLERLARRLRKGAGIEVPRFCLVTRVDGFGVYEDDTRRVLRPGDRLMAYAEVAGFVCQPFAATADGNAEDGSGHGTGWRVGLEVEFALDDRLSGDRLATWGLEKVSHTTRSKVRDLHITRFIFLPGDLAAGDYDLKVNIRDTLSEHGTAGGVRRISVAD